MEATAFLAGSLRVDLLCAAPSILSESESSKDSGDLN